MACHPNFNTPGFTFDDGKIVFIALTTITDITRKLIKVEISQKYQYDDKMDF
jgi:hypothetical protein